MPHTTRGNNFVGKGFDILFLLIVVDEKREDSRTEASPDQAYQTGPEVKFSILFVSKYLQVRLLYVFFFLIMHFLAITTYNPEQLIIGLEDFGKNK